MTGSNEIVVEVSKPGYNVLIADNKNLSFSSRLATHSIYNIVTPTKLSGRTQVVVQHGLGYIPKTWIFVLEGTAPNDYYRRIPRVSTTNGIDYFIDTLNITIQTVSTSELVFKVIIFTRSPNP